MRKSCGLALFQLVFAQFYSDSARKQSAIPPARIANECVCVKNTAPRDLSRPDRALAKVERKESTAK